MKVNYFQACLGPLKRKKELKTSCGTTLTHIVIYQHKKDEASELEDVRTQRTGNLETDCIIILSSGYCLRVNCLHVQSVHFFTQ